MLEPTLTRLTFRHEGDFVNCYYAPEMGFDGARLVSTMRRSEVDADKDLMDDWRTLMRLAFDRGRQRAAGAEAGA